VGPYFMVRPERVELSTFSLGMKCSIHLSYGRTGAIIADFSPLSIQQKDELRLIARSRAASAWLLFCSPFLMFLSRLDS